MKIPLSWLQEYIETGLKPADMAQVLTLAGMEVESIDGNGVLEIALTPNLGHCSCVVGIARELSAATNKTICYPKIRIKENASEQINKAVQVEIQDSKKCPRYACRLIKDVKIAPSPDWMQQRLLECGLRPINNIVDVTNYVLLELGHPLHAFDFDKIEQHKIIVRSAKEGERFVTLDETEVLLKEGDLLICDAKKPVALAGIMGGLNSEVTQETKNVLLEAAYFLPSAIRKTSKRLGIMTDSSKRFERGCDPNQVLQSLDRAAMLILQIAGGKLCEGTLDVKSSEFPPKQIECRLDRVSLVLGRQFSLSEVEEIFRRLGMTTTVKGQNVLLVTVPTSRVDISQEIDLIEEIARLFGFHNIAKEECVGPLSQLPHHPVFLFEREIKDRLLAEGLQEFVTCDLIGPTISAIVQEHLMPSEAIVKVLNPTSIEQSILRTSLMPGLLEVIKYNYDHQNHDVSGFEVGRIHYKEGEHYVEQSVVGIVMTGKNAPAQWDNKPPEVDFFDLKGIIENLLKQLHIPNVVFKNQGYKAFHSGRQASIYVQDLEIGSFGEVHPAIQRRLDVPQRILFAEMNLKDLMEVRPKETIMRALPKYPSSERDWTITLPEAFPIQNLLDAIYFVHSKLLVEVSVKDIYRNEKLGQDVKNATFHFIYRDDNKTVEQEEVDAEHQSIIREVESKLKTLI